MCKRITILMALVLLTLSALFLKPGLLRREARADTALTPTQVTEAFYTDYLAYARNEGNPLVDQIYRESPYLSQVLIARVDETLASFDGQGGFDPILLAQDVPESFTVSGERIEGETATTLVHTSFEGHVLQVLLARTGEGWQITQISRYE